MRAVIVNTDILVVTESGTENITRILYMSWSTTLSIWSQGIPNRDAFFGGENNMNEKAKSDQNTLKRVATASFIGNFVGTV